MLPKMRVLCIINEFPCTIRWQWHSYHVAFVFHLVKQFGVLNETYNRLRMESSLTVTIEIIVHEVPFANMFLNGKAHDFLIRHFIFSYNFRTVFFLYISVLLACSNFLPRQFHFEPFLVHSFFIQSFVFPLW